jgi:hypothetical protein
MWEEPIGRNQYTRERWIAQDSATGRATTKDENSAAHYCVIPAQAGIHSSHWMPAPVLAEAGIRGHDDRCGFQWDKIKDRVEAEEELTKTPWGSYKFVIRYPDGNRLGFVEKRPE